MRLLLLITTALETTLSILIIILEFTVGDQLRNLLANFSTNFLSFLPFGILLILAVAQIALIVKSFKAYRKNGSSRKEIKKLAVVGLILITIEVVLLTYAYLLPLMDIINSIH